MIKQALVIIKKHKTVAFIIVICVIAMIAGGFSAHGSLDNSGTGIARKTLLTDTDCVATDKSKDDEDNTEETSGKASSGSWLQPGTQEYKNAKSVWDAWKEKGLSGPAIAGIMGCIQNEGGFAIPDRAEGHYGNDKSAGVASGAHPSGSGGAGIYQFTPFTKFAPLGDKKWLDISKQTEYMWDSEVKQGLRSLNLGVITPTMLGTETDVAKATLNWANGAERGQDMGSLDTPSMKKRISDAKEAYKVFHGDEVKADKSLLEGANSSADTNDPTSNGNENPDIKSLMSCDLSNSENSDMPDGTGTHKESVGSAWSSFNELPEDVKQYAHDPAKLLGARGSGSKWIKLGVGSSSYDQCVGFSVAYGNALWNLSGNRAGNGIDTAKSFAKDLHIETTKTPHAGAIFSQNSTTVNGHTGVVMHVYANGDMLVAEQNFSGKSGEGNNEKFSWDFRIMGKKNAESQSTYYCYPGESNKHKIKWS